MAGGMLSDRLVRSLARALRLLCPRCGRAPLFRGHFRMNPVCAACELVFERAQGYWVGAIYLNYAVTSTLALVGSLAAWRLADLPAVWQLAIWIPFVAIFPIWFFPYSRGVWLAVEWAVNPEA